jgi:hypothetical protein
MKREAVGQTDRQAGRQAHRRGGGEDLKYVCPTIQVGVTVFKDNKYQNFAKMKPSNYKIQNSAHRL